MRHPANARWVKSSRSYDWKALKCVEVAVSARGDEVFVRDSKNPAAGALAVCHPSPGGCSLGTSRAMSNVPVHAEPERPDQTTRCWPVWLFLVTLGQFLIMFVALTALTVISSR